MKFQKIHLYFVLFVRNSLKMLTKMANIVNKSVLLPPALFITSGPEETSWKCDQCSLFFDSNKSFNLHKYGGLVSINETLPNPYKKVPQKRYFCKVCQNSFDTNQGLKQHIGKKHLKEKNSTCGLCNKAFIHKYALKFHVDQVHNKTTRIKCKYCENLFYNIYVMKLHAKKCKFRFPKNQV